MTHSLAETKKQNNIMVVDGSALYRTLIPRILRSEIQSANVTSCSSAQQALGCLESTNFNLITTPLQLPDMDGLELCRRIHKKEVYRFTPIIVVSGDDYSRLLREGFGAGVTDYFDKSRGYEEFTDFIKSFTSRNLQLAGKVLYVEDSHLEALVTGRLMQKYGLQVTHVRTAEKALELLQAEALAERQFDIVVTDFFLEGAMSGGDLLHAIRVKHHYSQQEMPVLMITGDNNQKKQADIFHAGGNDFVAKPIVEEVLMARLRSLLTIKQQFATLRQQSEELKHLATTDGLTGLHSKRYLLDHGERFISKPQNQPIWAVLIDIDNFKAINDKFGHITGDRVLAALGKLFNQHFIRDAMVVRFGGEEFSILLPCSSRQEAETQIENLRRKVEEFHPLDIPITISSGMASPVDHPGVNLNQLLSLADNALYAAKKAGRNCSYIFTPDGSRRLGFGDSSV